MKKIFNIIILSLSIVLLLSCQNDKPYNSKVIKKFLGDDYESILYRENSEFEINNKTYDATYYITYKIKSLNDLNLYYVKTKEKVEKGFDEYTLIDNNYSDSLARILDGDYKMTKNEITSKDGKVLYKYIGKKNKYTVSENIEQINDFAFLNVELKSLVLNKNLKKICNFAFSNSQISDLTIPSMYLFLSDTHKFRFIDFSFDKLKNLNITNQKNFVCLEVFKKLNTMKFSGNMTELVHSFYNYEINNLILPNTLKYIRSMAFNKMKINDLLIIPDSVIKIEEWAFYFVSDISIYIPSSVEIEEGTFEHATAIVYTDATEMPKNWHISDIELEKMIKIIYNTKLSDLE